MKKESKEEMENKRQVGIWIDHNKAVIVSHDGGREDVNHVESNVEGHVRLSGGARTASNWGPTDVAPEGRPERRRTQHLHRYYRDLIERMRDATRIYIFGPGEAKLEFEKEIRKSKELGVKIAAVETADKLTERQIIAKVRGFYKTHAK